MAEFSSVLKPNVQPENAFKSSSVDGGDNWTERSLSCLLQKDIRSHKDLNGTGKVLTLQSVFDDSNSPRPSAEISGKLPTQSPDTNCDHGDKTKQDSLEDKENSANTASTNNTADNTPDEDNSGTVIPGKQHNNMEDGDAAVIKRAQEEGHVAVVFPGAVNQEACCRFVSEILKCILYQRQQLPMTYDQLVYSQKKQQVSMQDKEAVSRRPVQSADMDWRKCQQTLHELEEVLQHVEELFSLSRVPRVLLLMGGSLVLPKELYEINMEALVLAGGDQCLRVSSCLRQLFRTLFVADLLSDTRPVRLMPMTLLALAHRDCGVGWFRPKLQFKVPARVKNQIIALCTDLSTRKGAKAEGLYWQDYVWFQAPMTIKGFSN